MWLRSSGREVTVPGHLRCVVSPGRHHLAWVLIAFEEEWWVSLQPADSWALPMYQRKEARLPPAASMQHRRRCSNAAPLSAAAQMCTHPP